MQCSGDDSILITMTFFSQSLFQSFDSMKFSTSKRIFAFVSCSYLSFVHYFAFHLNSIKALESRLCSMLICWFGSTASFHEEAVKGQCSTAPFGRTKRNNVQKNFMQKKEFTLRKTIPKSSIYPRDESEQKFQRKNVSRLFGCYTAKG